MQPAGWLQAAGQRLEYRHLGPPPAQAPTLVLLHEGLGCVQMWRDFPELLRAATGWGVFVYSRAGYGGSSACALPRPLDYMRDEGVRVLPALLAEMGFERGVLMGHSDGASIAAIHAGTVPHPGVLGLILMAPHFFTESITIDAIRRARAAYDEGDLAGGLALYHGQNLEGAFRGWNDAWLDPGFTAFDIRDRLPRIRVPLCVLQGRQDQYGSEEQVQVVRERARTAAQVHLLDDCAHSPHWDQPRSVLAAVSGFLAGLAME